MDFTVKAPLIQKIVAWKINMFVSWRALNPESMSLHERRREALDRLFNLRRELWTKSIPWLKDEIRKNETDRFLLGVAAATG
ncbi:hypothetical protein K8R03_00315 [Candidatus Kaiserbacteria bacterium]|nr:hypothetical protein [Candidatus Kaiserbacteria bacterium]